MSAPIAAMHSVVSAGTRHDTITVQLQQHQRLDKVVPLMSPNELQRVTEVFKAFESGANEATMYPKDLSAALKQLGLNPTETETHDLINEVEHNGLISFHDFCLVSIRKMRADDDEENFHQELFRVLVGPKNYASNIPASLANISRELLTFQQFSSVMTNLPEPVTPEMAAEMFAVADRDGNGRISFGEFKRMCLVERREVAPERPPFDDVMTG